MYVALIFNIDVFGEDTGALKGLEGVLIAANVFMIVAIVVESVIFLVKVRLEFIPVVNSGPGRLNHHLPSPMTQ